MFLFRSLNQNPNLGELSHCLVTHFSTTIGGKFAGWLFCPMLGILSCFGAEVFKAWNAGGGCGMEFVVVEYTN